MNLKWTDEMLYIEAKKYSTRNEFHKGSGGAYQACRSRKILDEVCAHMTKVRTQWTDEMLYIEAKKYSTRNEFKKGSSGAYRASQKRKIQDKVCAHMTEGNTQWTDEMLYIEAKKYKTRGEFHKGSSGAYVTCRSRKIQDEVCAHMEIVTGGYRGVTYYLENPKQGAEQGVYYGLLFTHTDGTQFVKMGITSNSIKERYAGYNKNGWSYKVITVHETTNLSTAYIEESFLRKYKGDYHYQLPDEYNFGGFKELFTLDIIPTIKKLFNN